MIGDSHADALFRGFSKDDKLSKIILYGCPPLVNITKENDNFGPDCNNDFKNALEYTSNENLKYVILHSRWPLFVEQARFDNKEGGEYGDEIRISFTNSQKKKLSESFRDAQETTINLRFREASHCCIPVPELVGMSQL